MMETTWFSFALFISFLFLVSLLYSKKQEKHENFPPSPPALPIVGHLHLLKQPLHKTLQTISKKYGPILLLQLGVRKVLIVSSPSAIEDCFRKNDTIFANRPYLLATKHLNYKHTVNTGPYGEIWRELRRILTLELFTNIRLTGSVNMRQNEVKSLMSELMKEGSVTDWRKVEMNSKLFEHSLNILTMMVIGKRYFGENAADAKEGTYFRSMLKEFLDLLNLTSIEDFLPALRWLTFQRMERKMIATMKKVDKFLQDLVDTRRQNLSRDDGNHEGKLLATIDTLILEQKGDPGFHTDEIIKGIVMILLIAGTESSFAALEWSMALLLNHPESIEKVRKEIDAHVGDNLRLIDEQDLPKLTYLQNVINEAMRVHPPIPFLIPHEASDDCVVGGYNIPKGTILLANTWALHRDPSWWAKAPEEFLPERFDEEAKDRYKFIPFGAGRRSCPGAPLGTRMVGLILGSLIQCFEWKRIGKEPVDMTASTGVMNSHRLKPMEANFKAREITKHLLA